VHSRLAICRAGGGDVEVVWISEALRSVVVNLQGDGGIWLSGTPWTTLDVAKRQVNAGATSKR
jgi:hypothetical protein